MAAIRPQSHEFRQEGMPGPDAMAIDPSDEMRARLWTVGVLVFVLLVTCGFFAVRSYYPGASDAPKLGMLAPFKT